MYIYLMYKDKYRYTGIWNPILMNMCLLLMLFVMNMYLLYILGVPLPIINLHIG